MPESSQFAVKGLVPERNFSCALTHAHVVDALGLRSQRKYVAQLELLQDNREHA